MKKIALMMLSCMLIITSIATAQTKGKITGKVVDSKSGEPIEYASVVLLKPQDSSMVNGGTTAENGSFSISAPYGTYILRITFMGYDAYYHNSHVTLSSKKNTVAMGKIQLKASATMMKEVTITAERSMVEYQLDKRVINVDKNIVSSGGTATDILENVPSVAIDNDGNVTLRGSTNVKVLVNGRPSELLSSDLETLLEQIPATSVENIEVITNPSAKYDPEGMSGIINIKLKDQTTAALGLNGIINANGGFPLPFMVPDGLPKFMPTAMGSINLNYTTEKYNIFMNVDGGTRCRSNHSTNYIERKYNGITNSIDSLIENNQRRFNMLNAKIGAEYFIDKKTSLLFSYQIRRGDHNRMNAIDAKDLLYNDSMRYDQCDTNLNDHINHTFNLSFVKKFDKPDQELSVDVTYGHRTGEGTGYQEQTYFGNAIWDNYYLRNTTTDQASNNLNIRVNYTHPFNEKMRLETGYEGRVHSSDQDYLYWITKYDPSHNLFTSLDQTSSTHYVSSQQIHAIYATFGAKIFDNMSAQAGLRAEYSDIKGKDKNHEEASDVFKQYYQLYPTLHLSYDINKDQSIQFSYSRRVRRPRMHDLNPYLDVREGQELSFGNPGIDPEFTNAFELSYNFGYKKINLFTSAYFRQTNNMMTRYGFIWDDDNVDFYSNWMVYNSEYDGYWATTWQNLAKGQNYGLEFIFDYQILKWWKLNLSINLYENYIEGTELLNESSKKAFRASGKFSSFMNLPSGWTIQLSGQYRAPFMDLQSEMMASYWADLAVKKDILNNRGTISLRVADVFCTGGWGHITESEQIYRKFYSKRISPSVILGFSYKLNNGLKANRKHNNDSDEEYEGDNGGEE